MEEAENALEKTYRVTQEDIKSQSGSTVSSKTFALSLDGGPFKFDYTRNGRHLALAGHTGNLSTMDWYAARAMTEVSVNETTRSIRWLHNESFFAAAQKRYVYIYDGRQGMEVHQLRGHIEVTQMEFLPYHFLLATVGLPGWLKYHDTSTGLMVAEHRTKLGSCKAMCQNPHNSIINLGHQNGTVTFWSPSVSKPHVRLLANLGPVTSVAIDPSSSGRIMSTTGMDGTLKVWDLRTYKTLASWTLKKPACTSAWSQKGLLAIGWGAHVSVYAGVGRTGSQKGAYMTQLFPSQEVEQVQFCPFEDILGVGHSSGFSHLITPGSGEAHFDSLEADPYENKSRRREREVKNLIDKIPADLITMNPDLVGSIAEQGPKESEELKKLKGIKKATPYRMLDRVEKLARKGKTGEDEALNDDDDDGNGEAQDQKGPITVKDSKQSKEKFKMRGKNSSLKRLMRKKHKNVITPATEALKARIALRKQRMTDKTKPSISQQDLGALSRFSK
ncbi:WD40-repeat-containing domain protein [Phakopsora pachyrhizi]|nr:WD40-repeat-containing domain protein [Phakopsora pachyrhizi]